MWLNPRLEVRGSLPSICDLTYFWEVGRIIYSILDNAIHTVGSGKEERTILKIPAVIAPIKVYHWNEKHTNQSILTDYL